MREDDTFKIGQEANGELQKERTHVIEELIEYIPNAVVSRTILKKSTGNITAMSFDAGEELGEKSSPFDTYVQIIHGVAQVMIGDIKHRVTIGRGIVIPANKYHTFNANEKFKMISTVIKSGYEDFSSNFLTVY